MTTIHLKSATLACRVSVLTNKAFRRRALREGKRPSEKIRELVERYAHGKAPSPRKESTV